MRVLTIDGVDFIPYLSADVGMDVFRFDKVGSNEDEMSDGSRSPDFLISKYGVSITFANGLTNAVVASLLAALEGESFTVQYSNPKTNSTLTATMELIDGWHSTETDGTGVKWDISPITIQEL